MRSFFTWISSFYAANCPVDTLQEQKTSSFVILKGINLAEAGVIESVFVSSGIFVSSSVRFLIMLVQDYA